MLDRENLFMQNFEKTLKWLKPYPYHTVEILGNYAYTITQFARTLQENGNYFPYADTIERELEKSIQEGQWEARWKLSLSKLYYQRFIFLNDATAYQKGIDLIGRLILESPKRGLYRKFYRALEATYPAQHNPSRK